MSLYFPFAPLQLPVSYDCLLIWPDCEHVRTKISLAYAYIIHHCAKTDHMATVVEIVYERKIT